MSTIKALTIRQPFAELICRGEKRVENRCRGTTYRGMLLIHAGKSKKWLSTYSPLPERMAFGAIVGRCELVDCVRYDEGNPGLRDDPHATGPVCWLLEHVERLERPIPYLGRQGLFAIDVLDLVRGKGFRLPHWLPAGLPARQCRVCGCTEHSPCEGGCYWVEPDLCSACEGRSFEQ